ncbi:MAG: tetratricopeptide repeat protein [Chitinophagaceae bacterium]|nr:tetratricopeptide repeat protein [Chitinophagaceae bacterium]
MLRYKSILVALFLQLAVVAATAQRSINKDSITAFRMFDIAEAFFTNGQYDSAHYYCDRMEAFSKLRNYPRGQAYALIKKTDIYIDQDILLKAAALPAITTNFGHQLKDSLIVAIAGKQTAQIAMYSQRHDEAIATFEKHIKSYFRHHPSKYAALAYSDLAYSLGENGDLPSSAANLLESIKVYETLDLDNYGDRAIALNNLSSIYYELKQKDKAIEYAKKSLFFREKAGDIAKLSLGCCNISQMYLGVDSAEASRYLDLCVKYAEQSKDESRIIHAYVTSAQIANGRQDRSTAVQFELKAISLLEKSKKMPRMLTRRYISVGMSYAKSGTDSLIALQYFSRALDRSREMNDKYNLRDVYNELAAFYRHHNDFEKAFGYFVKHISYRDSIINSNTTSNIAELEKKYETSKKDNEITTLNADQRINQLQIEKQKALLAANFLEAQRKEDEIQLLSKAQELQDLKIKQQEEALSKQLLEAKNNEQRLQLAEQDRLFQQKQLKNSTLIRNLILVGAGLLLLLAYFLFNRYQLKRKIYEHESLLAVRNNIAKDLHDDIGASLSNINILNELAKRNLVHDQARAASYIATAGEDIQRISESLSDIVWNVNPRYDDLNNLFIRMKRYAADMLDGRGIQYQFEFPDDGVVLTLPMEKRRNFYLLFKEAVNNMARYSKARNARISISIVANQISMLVQDDGQGFDTSVASTGNGIVNMHQRAQQSGAQLKIESNKHSGTRVELVMEG